MAKFLEVIGLHDFCCYLDVASSSLTPVICHVFMHFLGSFLLQDMFSSLQVFAFEGQNMRFVVKMLLTCILYCDTGPRCD